MNEFLKQLKNDTNYAYTENGGVTHKSTLNAVLDMFAMGGAMRMRTNEDIILMFKKAYQEDATLALRCLFYLRDIRGGQGERRFFRVCLKWLANEYPNEASNVLTLIPTYGRYDDLFELIGTPVEKEMFAHLWLVVQGNKDALVYKWLKSENTSSKQSRDIATKTRKAFGLSSREYRKMLSEGRKACHLVETAMSQNRWDEIDFSKLPSRAGLLYKHAFMNREETKERYAAFMSSKETKVNASTLNPVDIAHQIFHTYKPSTTERKAWDKYWAALPDYYNGKEEPGIAIVDVSGSMEGVPMEAAVSMGAYIAERGKGPFHNYFITFSGHPELVEFEGVDLYDKFERARRADWGMNTNIEAVFDILLQTAVSNRMAAEDMPRTLSIFSDFEFDKALTSGTCTYDRWDRYNSTLNRSQIDTVIEAQARKWRHYGYTVPRIIFWNLRAAQQNIPAIGPGFSYVSGYSVNMISCILGGKDGWDLCLEKLNSNRYSQIYSVR